MEKTRKGSVFPRFSDLVCVVVSNLLLVQFLLVDSPPGVDDVCQYEGDEIGHEQQHKGNGSSDES